LRLTSGGLTRQRGLDVIACVWVAQVLFLGARLPLGRYSPTNHGKSRPHLQRRWATRSVTRVVVLMGDPIRDLVRFRWITSRFYEPVTQSLLLRQTLHPRMKVYEGKGGMFQMIRNAAQTNIDVWMMIDQFLIALVFLCAFCLLMWGLYGDRSKGRTRCPKCWYDMRGRRPGREGLTCPECGHDARHEHRLLKNRRRWRVIVLGLLLLLPPGYLLSTVAGWYRERPVLQAIEGPPIQMPAHVRPGPSIGIQPVGPPWLIQHLPKRLVIYFDRCVALSFLDAVSVGPDRLSRLRHLRRLKFFYADLDDTALADIGRLTHLESLSLSGKRITDAGLEHLKELSNLRGLRLIATNITGTGFVHLTGLKKLGSLHLRSTKVADEGLAHLQKLKTLTYLDVENTDVTPSGVAALKRTLPSLYVHY